MTPTLQKSHALTSLANFPHTELMLSFQINLEYPSVNLSHGSTNSNSIRCSEHFFFV